MFLFLHLVKQFQLLLKFYYNFFLTSYHYIFLGILLRFFFHCLHIHHKTYNFCNLFFLKNFPLKRFDTYLKNLYILIFLLTCKILFYLILETNIVYLPVFYNLLKFPVYSYYSFQLLIIFYLPIYIFIYIVCILFI